ncbi:FtsW/RodA/SpoVE family cell cycle protein [Campylobacter gastrosuis]|uniref:Probable peptidoglycan glycosyltransferase FtsW n=1 Tax=Campylobacter gastrosuis TaxID=2974576 RepID=A0ABT7HP94_9BACT|nr:FtsW/RodA/SpoVE family cell cycle protein [Campylobacter gastrosuis]MDL0088219.1 FtsW/RodA/SpoVE family cell cycle protein [Campylobacter gastrosuis]
MSADKSLFYLSVTLLTIGVIFSFSLPVFVTLLFDYSEFHFFIRQFVVCILGIFLMWSISLLDANKTLKFIGTGLLLGSLILMGLMYFLPSSIVTEVGGAKRWIKFPGFSLAPVEFFKIGFVYFLALSFSRKIDNSKKTLKDELKILLPYLGIFGIVIYLIAVLQNDLGQVIVLAATLIMMALFAGTSFKIFSIGSFGAILVAFGAIVSSEHRILRIKSWWGNIQDMVLKIFPDSMANVLRVDDAPEPYQIGHSLNAIRHGEIFGEGLGAGVVKLGYLSEVHTDFVLAGIAEEAGVVGIIVIVGLLITLLYRIFLISSRSEDRCFHLFTLGIGLLISFSFIMNSYGITSITPIKGIAVPFLSYGGSSILATCVGIGMVLMISKKANL